MSQAEIDAIFAKADPEQVKMMAERVILLDYDDNVVGHESKTISHLNENIQKGMLHRAFSVFLFSPEGKLVLQQRALTKVTFPGYYANTCCSHPLYVPEELDMRDEVGVKRAARRKLEQELGIPQEDVPMDSFTYITRVHYVASSDGMWGEHEIDYILFCQPKKLPRFDVNPNEVASVKWFTRMELAQWMAAAPSRGDRICPWFQFIHDALLHTWWSAAEQGKLHTCYDPVTIHRAPGVVPPPPKAAPVPKQGAYGKVKVHKHSIVSQLLHASEVWAVLKMAAKLDGSAKVSRLGTESPSLVWCEEKLVQVSRSFAMVIQQLPMALRTAIGNFYLVLRGLDTVEDDMDSFPDVAVKVAHLNAFHTYLNDPSWKLSGIGEGAERELLEGFEHVIGVFSSLPAEQREVIADITARMGGGMALYSSRNLRQGTEDIADYDMYCHFVAGLVGEGLSRLFSAAGFEAPAVAEQIQIANDMGLFLQKTNIIRDYLEDYVEGRAFWPKEIWGEYAADLGDFANKPTPKAISCLNHMIANAMTHVPACLRYLSKLADPAVFRFCAIPQVMAIATLEELASNPLVFTGVVKIRKGLAVKLISQAKDMAAVSDIFLTASRSIQRKLAGYPSQLSLLRPSVSRVESICIAGIPHRGIKHLFSLQAVLLVAVCLAFLLRALDAKRPPGLQFPPVTSFADIFLLGAAFLCSAYLVAFTGVPLVLSVLSSPEKEREALEQALRGAGAYDERELALKHAEYVSWPEKEAAALSPKAGAAKRSPKAA